MASRALQGCGVPVAYAAGCDRAASVVMSLALARVARGCRWRTYRSFSRNSPADKDVRKEAMEASMAS
jgi:hypothetical protein